MNAENIHTTLNSYKHNQTNKSLVVISNNIVKITLAVKNNFPLSVP